MVDKPIRILHVDDMEAEFILLRNLLSMAQDVDFELHWASNTQTATQILHNNTFDVCLVDYYLDTDNGLDFIRKLISRGITTPIILLSGQRNPAIDFEASQIGVRQCINKNDITTSILLTAIQSALRG